MQGSPSTLQPHPLSNQPEADPWRTRRTVPGGAGRDGRIYRKCREKPWSFPIWSRGSRRGRYRRAGGSRAREWSERAATPRTSARRALTAPPERSRPAAPPRPLLVAPPPPGGPASPLLGLFWSFWGAAETGGGLKPPRSLPFGCVHFSLPRILACVLSSHCAPNPHTVASPCSLEEAPTAFGRACSVFRRGWPLRWTPGLSRSRPARRSPLYLLRGRGGTHLSLRSS